MTIIEALTLAKEQGKKVRPVVWRQWEWYVTWQRRDLHFHIINAAGFTIDERIRMSEENILGPWEVVE